MDIGELRHRIVLQSKTDTVDSHGQVVQTWATTTTVWGSVQPLTGQELIVANSLQSQISHKVTCRYIGVVTTLQRIQHKGRTFEILSVANTDERNRELIIMAKETL